MIKSAFLYLITAAAAIIISTIGTSAFAGNLSANNCQIFIRRLQALPSPHGNSGLNVFVKVNWLGNNEYIQNVGFYATNNDVDLGNSPSCGNSRSAGTWYIQSPLSGSYPSMGATEYGEYVFNFPIKSGSVAYDCPGYSYSTKGAFFVQTNKNTYWLNPDMDPTKHFYFDENGFRNITNLGGTYRNVFTDSDSMRYYNPLRCHR